MLLGDAAILSTSSIASRRGFILRNLQHAIDTHKDFLLKKNHGYRVIEYEWVFCAIFLSDLDLPGPQIGNYQQ